MNVRAAAWGTPPLAYQWRRNEQALSDDERTHGADASTLTVSNVTPADAGAYLLVVSNALDAVTSSVATLTTIPAAILQQPHDMIVSRQSNATFQVAVDAFLPLAYQWWKDGQALTNDGRISGATGPALLIANMQPLDVGAYWVVAGHQYGAVTSIVTRLEISPFNLAQAGAHGAGLECTDVHATGTFAWITGPRCLGPSLCGKGLRLLDVADLGQVQQVGGDTNWGHQSLYQDGPYLYQWTATSYGFSVVDVCDPVNPLRLGGAPLDSYCFDLHVAGAYAYVASMFTGFQVYDVSEPASPTLSSVFHASSLEAVKVVGSRAYVLSFDYLWLLDVSNANNAVWQWQWNLSDHGISRCLQVAEPHAFVGTLNTGVKVFDVRQPATGFLALSTYQTRSRPYAMFLAGRYLFVAEGSAGLEVLDVAIPTNIVRVAEYDTAGVATAVHVVGPSAYVADGTNGLVVLSLDARTNAPPELLTQPKSQSVLAERDTQLEVVTLGSPPLAFQWWWNGTNALPGATNASLPLWDLAVTNAGDYTVVVSNAFGVVTSAVATLTVPLPQITILTNPQSHSVYRGTNAEFSVAAVGTPPIRSAPITYQWSKGATNLSDGDRISGTTTPTLRLTNAAPDDAGDYTVVMGNRFGVAVTSAAARLQVVTPAACVPLGGYSAGLVSDIRVTGRYAYVAGPGGLQVLDVSNPTNLVWVGGYHFPGYAWRVRVVGSRAYLLAAYPRNLEVLDVSNLADIQRLGGYTFPGIPYDLQVAGSLVFVANDTNGLQVLDVSQPTNIVRVGEFQPGGFVRNVWVQGSLVFLTAGPSGLHVLDASEPTRICLLGRYVPGTWVGAVQVADSYAYLGIESVVAVVRIDFPSLAPPTIESPTVCQDEFRFSFLSAAGTPYTLEYKSRLDDPAWTGSARRLGIGQRLWITNSPASAGSRFYRLRVE